jgi:anti-sigma B factor antagonist
VSLVLRPEDLISASVHDRDGIAVLAIRGELDMSSSAAFKCAISEALAGRPQALVIDLSDVEFLGSAGISVLLEARDRVGDGDQFAVVTGGPVTGRTIEVLALGELLCVRETVDEALSAVAAH